MSALTTIFFAFMALGIALALDAWLGPIATVLWSPLSFYLGMIYTISYMD